MGGVEVQEREKEIKEAWEKYEGYREAAANAYSDDKWDEGKFYDHMGLLMYDRYLQLTARLAA